MKPALNVTALISLLLAGCSGGPAPIASIPAPSEAPTPRSSGHASLDQLIASHARAQNVPESLIHAVVRRETNYNPSLRNGPFWGLMQIRYDTAQSMGYRGSPSGLLDADTNLTYGVAYLANAYRVAHGDHRRAIQLYAGGYYYEAKRQGLLGEIHPASLH